eukprot:EG_transcript_10132
MAGPSSTGPKQLGWVHGMALVVGGVVGSGLFVSPGDVFAMCGSVGWGLVVWVLAGVLCLIGGVCYAELGCAVRRSGGEYAIMAELLGAPFAFAFAWMSFWIQCPAAVGVLSLTFARYVAAVAFPLDVTADIDRDWRVRCIAIASIVVVGLANSFGLKGGAVVNTVITVLKLVAIVGVLGMGLSQADTGAAHFEDPFAINKHIPSGGSPSMIALAVVSALWSYDGWNMLNYLAGEVDMPERNLPRCVIWGMVLVIFVTVLTNIAFLLILPPNVVATNKALAVTAGEALFGPAGGYAMSLVVAINVYGVMQTCLLSYPFIYNEAALDGLFPAFLTDPARDIALPAIWIPMAMAAGMVLVGSFTVLTQVYGVATYCFYVLSMVSLIRLRRRGIVSLYRVPFHPLLAVVFILCSVVLIANALVTAPVQSATGVGFCLLSYPVYLGIRQRGWGKSPAALGQEPLLGPDPEEADAA